MLSLKEALSSGKLDAFIKQEEARGIGPVSKPDLDTAIKAVIKQPQSKGQT